MRRRPRLVLALLAAVALLAVTAPAEAAPGDPLSLSGPADGAGLIVGAPVDLRARGVAADSALELRVSRSPAVADACGRINAEVAQAHGVAEPGDPALFDFTTGPWFEQAGTYWWQVNRTGADGSCVATGVRRLVLTGTLPARPELAGLARERIPRSIGRSNGAAFRIRTSGVPAGVSRARFLAIVRNSAPLAAALRRDRAGAAAVRQRPLRGGLLDHAGPARGTRGDDHRAQARRRARARPHHPRRHPVRRGAGASGAAAVRPRDRDPARARPFSRATSSTSHAGATIRRWSSGWPAASGDGRPRTSPIAPATRVVSRT